MLPNMVRLVIAFILLTSWISAAEQPNTLNLPKGWDTWPLADSCASAVALFDERANREQVKADSKANWYYYEGQTSVDVRDEEGTCAMVQVDGVAYGWGWVPWALLSKPTPAQIENKTRAAQAAYLRSLPTLNNGNAAIFLGADRKCSEQFVQAMSLEGLEKRKKMAELVTFGCGFLVDAGAHVKRLEENTGYCRVTPVEGKQLGKPGWVPCGWVK
jgi:hypothetical protein